MVRSIVIAAFAALCAAAAFACTRAGPPADPGHVPAPPLEPGRCLETVDCPGTEVCIHGNCLVCGGCLLDSHCPAGHICESHAPNCTQCIPYEPEETTPQGTIQPGEDPAESAVHEQQHR